jgi:hypothetical protein
MGAIMKNNLFPLWVGTAVQAARQRGACPKPAGVLERGVESLKIQFFFRVKTYAPGTSIEHGIERKGGVE